MMSMSAGPWHGARNALLRLAARGLVVCGLGTSHHGFPRRVWAVKATR